MEESVKRAAERVEKDHTPLERLRGDAFSGGTVAVQHRRAKHMLWKDAMRTAQLLNLGEEVAWCHWWRYIADEEPPGALPFGGVEGTALEGLCCGFIWPKMVHGYGTSNLKYCYSCLKYDGVKRWLCPGCRDNRPRTDNMLVAHCMPGYCPALQRRFDEHWHTAELNRPPWFKEWAEDPRFADFEQWPTSWRSQQLERWYPGFLSGYHTRQLSAAQLAAHAAVDPWRARVTTLPDDMSFDARVREKRLAR